MPKKKGDEIKVRSKYLILVAIIFLIFLTLMPAIALNHTRKSTNLNSADKLSNTTMSMPDLLIERVTIPDLIYAQEENPVIITVKNEGDADYVYNSSKPVNISLAILENRTQTNVYNESLRSVIPKKESIPVYICYNFSSEEKNTSLYIEIDSEGRLEEKNKKNNNATLNITLHRRLYDEYKDEERKNAINKSFVYLEGEEGETLDFIPYSYIATVTPLNSTFYTLEKGRMTSHLKEHAKDIINSTEVRDWAIATTAISSLGHNPKNFSGINFIGILYSFFDGTQFGSKGRLDDDIFALISLSSAGERDEVINKTVENLMASQNEDGGWSYNVGGNKSSVTYSSLAIQAIISTGIVNHDNNSLKNATNFIKNNQLSDGGFPYVSKTDNKSSPYATALTISALAAYNQSKNAEVIKNATDFLLKAQNEDGYFKDSVHGKLKPTVYAIIALHHEYFLPFHQKLVNITLPDIYPVDFTVKPRGGVENENESESLPYAYANITNEVIAKIKNNGGVFNVSLINKNSSVLGEQRLIEKKSSNVTEVKFEWKPISDGITNLTISADTKDEIEEENEKNNSISKKINVKLPDLYPDLSLIENKTFYSNFSNDFPVEIKGFGENFNSSLIVNSSFDNGNITVTDNITNITSYLNQKANFSWKPVFKGNYSFNVSVDSNNDVKESDEKNNTKGGEVKVNLPDVLPYNISFLPPGNELFKNKFLLVNKSNLINVSLRGVGENFNVSLYAYPIKGSEAGNLTNSTSMGNLTNDSLMLEKKAVSRLFGNGSICFQWVPSEEGFYRIIAELDTDDDIYEANESNNWIFVDIEAINEAPEIRLISPRGGENFVNRNFIEVRWDATDPNDDTLNINISYSPAYGRNWINIVDNEENDGEYQWPVKGIPDGEYMLMVEASDGNFTDFDVTVEPFTICNEKSYEEAPQFHYDAGFSLSEAPDTNETAWISKDIGAVDSSSPIVAGGKIFIYCNNESGTFLTALNESNGQILWKKELDERKYGSWSSPGYHAGNVFIGSGKHVYSINAENGEVKWDTPVEKKIVISSPTIAYGKIFIGGYGESGHPEYYCLNEENGTILWRFNETKTPEIEGGRATATPAFYNGNVFVGIGSWEGGGHVYCLSENGTPIWNITTDYGVWGMITAIHNTLYFGTYNVKDGEEAIYYAIYPTDGSEKWEIGGIETDSSPAYAFGNLYICSGCPGYSAIATHCLNPETGKEIWKKKGVGGWTISPVVSKDGKLIVGKLSDIDSHKGDGTYCLDALTGKEIWSSPYGGSTAVITNGRVYTIGQGKVYAFGPSNTPDLNISSFEAPESIYVDETKQVNVTVKNIGDGDVNKSFNVSLRVNGDEIAVKRISSLNVSEEKTLNFSWTAEEKDIGVCRLVTEVDPDDKITESNPLNNKAVRDVEVMEKKPDLTPVYVKTADKIYINRETTLTIIVENIGKKEANNVLVALQIGFDKIGSKTIETLKSDENRSVEFKWTPKSSGKITLTAEIDPEDKIKEINEGNNIISKEINVYKEEEEIKKGIGGGAGAGGSGTADWMRKRYENGTGEKGTGVGAGGGVQKPINESETVSKEEKIKEATGHPFGNASSGKSSSTGGGMLTSLPIKIILLLLIFLSLFYFGYYREKKAHRRRKRENKK